MKLKELPSESKPREKAMQFGVEQLSNTEILSLILGSGHKQNDVTQLAAHITNAKLLSISSLKKIKGIGTAKACAVLGAIELGRRYTATVSKAHSLSNPRDMYLFFRTFFEATHEKMIVGCFDARLKYITHEVVAIGNLEMVPVSVRNVFLVAIKHCAHSIVLVHNHPSGNATASNADLFFTAKMLEASKNMQIPLLDHIIIGNDSYWSYKESTER
jgi:DNA repair protein RadC